MKRSEFSYDLPPELIAQHPLPNRDDSRLLTLDGATGAVQHRRFTDLVDCVDPGDLLVFNDTRVIPARLYGRKSSGGRVEILVERITGSHEALAHIRSSKSPRTGTVLVLSATPDAEAGPLQLEVCGRQGDLFMLSSAAGVPIAQILATVGHMPLPPYIQREDAALDQERYQTVYGRREGAVAAPTAGLHFTEALLQRFEAKGVNRAHVTLHVGAGTFQPVREEDIEHHRMHAEYVEVDQQVVDAVLDTRDRGGRVIAVGTTAVRSLETACLATGQPQPFSGDTDIFIYPGYRFRCVDALVTNFHLPESTLLMLVSAFAGRRHIMSAYREAIEQRYRFFSYGDAMYITARPANGSEG